MRSTLQRLFMVVVLFVFHASAQAQTLVDVVYLKNGSIIRGVIIEQVPNESLKVQTRDGSVFFYAMAEVEKIGKEEEEEEEGGLSRGGRPPVLYNRSGFVNHTQLSFGLGLRSKGTVTIDGISRDIAERPNSYLRVETSNGFWIADGLLSLGLGVGVEYYNRSWVQLPLYADLRVLPLMGNVSPMLIAQVGYSIGTSGSVYNNRNGIELAAGLGVNMGVSNNMALNISILYDYNQMMYSYDVNTYPLMTRYEYNIWARAVRFSLGLSF